MIPGSDGSPMVWPDPESQAMKGEEVMEKRFVVKRGKRLLMLVCSVVLCLQYFTGVAAAQSPNGGDSRWSDMFGPKGMDSRVYSLAFDGSGNLYAGGSFTTTSNTVAYYIAKWDGSSWSTLGSGMNSYVYALAVDGSGNLYAGGSFTTAGGVAAAGRPLGPV